jgi:hypothetical protein
VVICWTQSYCDEYTNDGYDYDVEKIISDSFDEDPSRLLETLVYNIEVEDSKTYFIGQQSIWVHAAHS